MDIILEDETIDEDAIKDYKGNWRNLNFYHGKFYYGVKLHSSRGAALDANSKVYVGANELTILVTLEGAEIPLLASTYMGPIPVKD